MKFVATITAMIASSLAAQPASAQAIDILSAGAIEPGIHAAAAQYRRETGTEVKIRFATAPSILKQMADGAKADIVIAPPPVIDQLAKSGKVDGTTLVPVGKVGVGVVARAGAPTPDISNAEALKKSALAAESLVFNTASTGLYMDRLFERMGIAAEVKAKAKRYGNGNSVMEHLIKGSGREFGFGAATEIALFKEKGLRLIGPLPAEVQNHTSYSATAHATATNPKGAGSFLQFLAKPATRKIFADKGVE